MHNLICQLLEIQSQPYKFWQISFANYYFYRGISVALMIFVNYGGGQFWFFKHSPWNGLTVADLVFPWFMWIMGVAVALGTQAQMRRGVKIKKLFCNIMRRTVILFALGIMLNSGKCNDFRLDLS